MTLMISPKNPPINGDYKSNSIDFVYAEVDFRESPVNTLFLLGLFVVLYGKQV